MYIYIYIICAVVCAIYSAVTRSRCNNILHVRVLSMREIIRITKKRKEKCGRGNKRTLRVTPPRRRRPDALVTMTMMIGERDGADDRNNSDNDYTYALVPLFSLSVLPFIGSQPGTSRSLVTGEENSCNRYVMLANVQVKSLRRRRHDAHYVYLLKRD